MGTGSLVVRFLRAGEQGFNKIHTDGTGSQTTTCYSKRTLPRGVSASPSGHKHASPAAAAVAVPAIQSPYSRAS
jgi:hypothetical protein